MKFFRRKITQLKNRLTKISDEEPLSKLSLVVIIGLDIFILSVLFTGLADHTDQLTSPDEYVPYECRNVFIDKDWSEATKLNELQHLVLSDYNNFRYRYNSSFESSRINVMHPLCKQFYQKIKSVAENNDLKNFFVSRQDCQKQLSQHTKRFNKSKDVYNTSLAENNFNKNGGEENLPSVSAEVQTLSNKIEELNEELTDIEKQINANPLIKDLWNMLMPQANENRDQVIKDYKNFEFWYPLKKLGWELLFMLPIFFVFYFWNARSIKKDHYIQTLISSHLLVIASIPIFMKFTEVVLDLIPQHFFKNLFMLLEILHLIAIWHYVVILISIGIALFLVYIIQKKIFNKHRLQQKRLMKGACYFCGKKLPSQSILCPFCGTNQYTTCNQCNKETYACASYCIHCGIGGSS